MAAGPWRGCRQPAGIASAAYRQGSCSAGTVDAKALLDAASRRHRQPHPAGQSRSTAEPGATFTFREEGCVVSTDTVFQAVLKALVHASNLCFPLGASPTKGRQ